MANVVYPLAKQRLLEWALAASGPAGAATVNVIGVKSSYVYSASHEHIADVPGADIVAPETELDNVTTLLGVMKADNPTLTGMTAGQTLHALIVFARWAGDSLLLCYMDTPADASLPALINSTTGLLAFDASGIFSL
jgi:hypothetical protein